MKFKPGDTVRLTISESDPLHGDISNLTGRIEMIESVHEYREGEVTFYYYRLKSPKLNKWAFFNS